MCSSTERRGGFVLMEAVMALAIIAIVAIGLLAAAALQVRTADKAALLLHARALAEDRMAMLRVLDNESLGSLPDSLVNGVFPPPFEAFSWQATVSPIRDEHDLFAAQVTVFVADEAFVLDALLHEPQLAGGGI
jgi:type II secretory pathway pseudopilin PulG